MQQNVIPFYFRRRKNQIEATVSSGITVNNLIVLVLPYLVVRRPLAEQLLDFNKGKNRRHRWDGSSIRSFFDK